MYDTNDALLARQINVGDICHRGTRRRPNKLALVMGERRLTYRELVEASNCVANGMFSADYGAGTRVAILARNSLEFFIVYFVAAKAGAVLCPANPALPDRDLEYVLNHAEVNALLSMRLTRNECQVSSHGCQAPRGFLFFPLPSGKNGRR